MSDEDDFVDLFVNAKVDLLSARYHRAMDALRRYGKHDKNCAMNKSLQYASRLDRCTCGYSAALESLR